MIDTQLTQRTRKSLISHTCISPAKEHGGHGSTPLLADREAPRGENREVSQRLLPHARNVSSNLPGVCGKILAAIFSGVLIFSVPFEGRAEEPVAKVKAPEFVPIVVDQNQYQAAMAYLGGLKFSDAAPVVKWLNELEERAKGNWEADHQPKAEPAK
jgi:hypothetical protein